MKCLKCKTFIDIGEEYIKWGGFTFCGTACVVEHLVEEDGLELKVREDTGTYTGTHFPNLQ